MRAVSPEQILAGKPLLASAVDVLGDDSDALAVMLYSNHFEAVGHPRAGFLGAAAQDRLEARLGDEQPPARTKRVDALVETGDERRDLLAGEIIDGNDRALGSELLFRLCPDLGFDSARAEQFYRAHMKEGGARQRQHVAQPFDRERTHSMFGQKHGRRQSDQASAGNQNRRIEVFGRHAVSSRVLRTESLLRIRAQGGRSGGRRLSKNSTLL